MKWTDLEPGDMVIEASDDGELLIFILLCVNDMLPTWITPNGTMHVIQGHRLDTRRIAAVKSALAVFNSNGEIKYLREISVIEESTWYGQAVTTLRSSMNSCQG